ncbi:MAG: IS110 family transposase [Spirochaetia bacterium]|nr:IS110 family transposase [Spirochaetia bacterium]
MKHYIGIDNANLTHSVSIIDENGNLLKGFEIENNNDGFQKLRMNLNNYTDPVIAMEIPHGPLVDFLRTLTFKKFSLNPLKVKRFKEIYSVSGNKNDIVDSNAIAQYIRFNEKKSREMIFNSQEVETLKLLGISHERMKKEHTRYTNRLLFIFRQYFPLYDALFSETAPKILLKMVIKYPIWTKLKAENQDDLKKFFIANKYCNGKYIEKSLKKIHDYVHNVAEEVETALSFEATTIANILLMLKSQIAEIEKEMAKITSNHSMGKIFDSLPGAGALLAGKLLGMMGDNKNRFSNANQAQCLFGTAPMNYQSGGYHKVITRKACNKRSKSILYAYAFSSLRFSKWARGYYDKQRKLGKRHSVAIRALSNKWLKIIYSMWQHEQVYNEKLKSSIAA